MKIGVLSDSHDNIWNLDRALPELAKMDTVIHCGDLIAPFVMRRLGEGLPEIPVHIVWGNNDGDLHLLTKVAAAYPQIELHGQLGQFTADDWQVAVSHYPEIAQDMAATGKYQLVCYGHDHKANHEIVGETILLNPGEIMGMNGRSSWASVDSWSGAVEFIDVPDKS